MHQFNVFNCRLRSRLAILGVTGVLICFILLYRAVIPYHSDYHINHKKEASVERRNIQILNPSNKDGDLGILLHEFQLGKINSVGVSHKDSLTDDLQSGRERDLLNVDKKEALTKYWSELFPTHWKQGIELDDVALDLKHLLSDYGLESNMSCRDIDSLKLGDMAPITSSKLLHFAYDSSQQSEGGRGWSMYHRNSGQQTQYTYLVKSSASDRQVKIDCMKQVYDSNLCASMGNYKLLREILLLSVLRHPNVLLMKGYCLRGSRLSNRLQDKGVVMLTEVGSALPSFGIDSLPWHQRVSMALQVSKLLVYLDQTPLGSLRLTKLDLKDFVLVNNSAIKLVDFDDLECGEKACSSNSDCSVPDLNKELQCSNGLCQNFNSLWNLAIATKGVLLPLLQNPPVSGEAFYNKLKNQELSLTELVATLQVLFNKSAEETAENNFKEQQEIQRDTDLQRQANRQSEKKTKLKFSEDHRKLDQVLSNFLRYDNKNFAGAYDYMCTDSRVTWGCVHTVTSLLQAASLCIEDPHCRAFITFSTQPEVDSLMTVVLKNGTDLTPQVSSGTTLFIQRPPRQLKIQQIITLAEEDSKKKEAEIEEATVNSQTCADKLLQTQDFIRYSREKRLMAHLGLKGTREKTWSWAVLHQQLEGFQELVSLNGEGGKFLTNLTSLDTGSDLKQKESLSVATNQVLFIAEDGPYVYHMAFAVLYQMDRLLGLYHTPPCVGKQMSGDEVDLFLSDDRWDRTFRSLIDSDGSLMGILVAPVPNFMKSYKLTLQPRKRMVKDIVTLSRSERNQLEYLLLCYLGRMSCQNISISGFKGHLVHVNADRAFESMDQDFSGYLNYCQFPEVVYRTLECFKCDTAQSATNSESNVCSLGEEVIRRSLAMFSDPSDIFIHNLPQHELVASINSAATSVLRKVDNCIKTFSSTNVLY